MKINKAPVNKAGVQLKAMDDAGQGLAVIATLSAIDGDGDTYAPGAFMPDGQPQWAKILPGHSWQSVPLGKARVYEEGNQALAELHLNLETEAGREWHKALKFDLSNESAPPLQEWSYGFFIKDSESETREGNRVRVLKRLDVFEVSPVVLGAGVGTRTLAMKGQDADGGGSAPFHEQLDAVIAGAGDVLLRARDLKALRNEDGRGLSATRLKQLQDLQAGLKALLDEADAERRAHEDLVARAAAFGSKHVKL